MGAELSFWAYRAGVQLLLPGLDERARRLALGAVARAAGDGGISAVARVTGASWQTVADGAEELGSGDDAGRAGPAAGGGRKKLEEPDPGLIPALLALVEDRAGGIRCRRSVDDRAWHLSGELTAAGHPCARRTRGGCCTRRGSAPRATSGHRGQAAPGPGRPVPVHRRPGQADLTAGSR